MNIINSGKIRAKFTIACLIMIFIVLLFPGQTQAIMLQMDFEELARRADFVVSGTVVNLEARWDYSRSNIYTLVTIASENTFKGDELPDLITVVVPGGQVDGITQIVSDTPAFTEGEETLLFLNRSNWQGISFNQLISELYEVCGSFQGKADLKADQVYGLSLEELEDEINTLVESELYSFFLDPLIREPEFVSNYQFVTLPFRWPGQTPVVPYYINASDANTLKINAAATTWNNAGSNLSFHYQGPHTRSGGPFQNSRNEIQGINMSNTNALAVASIWVTNGFIDEADMTFNTLYNWSSTYDVQTVALHEFGHWAGLDHSGINGSIMFSYYQGVQHTLHSTDLAGIRYIYGTPVIEPVFYTLTIGVEGQGSTTPVAGAHTCDEGEIISLAASASEGWQFDHWLINGSSYNESEQILTVNRNYEATAFFTAIPPAEEGEQNEGSDNGDEEVGEQEQIQLVIAREGNGTTRPDQGTHSYDRGTILELQAEPDQGWQFDRWIIGSQEITTPVYTITVEQNLTVTAIFTEISTTEPDPGASPPPADPVPPAQPGPAPSPSPAPAPDPTPAEAVPAEQCQITVSKNGSGTVTPAVGSHNYSKGAILELKAVADRGWHFTRWVVDGEIHRNSILNITIEKTVQATAYFNKSSKGDLNDDGKITVSDVVKATRYSLGLEKLTEEQLASADVNGDGVVDVRDITLMMRLALGLIDSFPIN